MTNGFLSLLLRPDIITPTLHRTNWDQTWLKSWEVPAFFGCRSLPSSSFPPDSCYSWVWGVQPPKGLWWRCQFQGLAHWSPAEQWTPDQEPTSSQPAPVGRRPDPLHAPSPLQNTACDLHPPRQRKIQGWKRAHTNITWTAHPRHVFLNSWLLPAHLGKVPPCPSSHLPLPVLSPQSEGSPAHTEPSRSAHQPAHGLPTYKMTKFGGNFTKTA